MIIVNNQQMQRIDQQAIKSGISGKRLMWNAGTQAFKTILEIGNFKQWIIIGGRGNNGGDAWVIVNHCLQQHIPFQAFVIGKITGLSADAQFYFNQVADVVTPIKQIQDLKILQKAMHNADLLIDGIFGTGLNKKITGIYQKIIKVCNQNNICKVALDIPSGISGDTGEVLGIALHANITLSFQLPKWGHVLKEGPSYSGQLKIIDIGISKRLFRNIKSIAELNDYKTMKSWIPVIDPLQHKARHGRVLVIAGSKAMPGAGILASQAVLRSGTGLVHLAYLENSFTKVFFKFPETILLPLPDQQGVFAQESIPYLSKQLHHFKVIALGPGLGRQPSTTAFVEWILSHYAGPVVLDADGLFHAKHWLMQTKHNRKIILTPHSGEMAYLWDVSSKDVENNRIDFAKKTALRCKVIVVLKGKRTILADPKGNVFINPTGCHLLATAGSGDILTGLMAGLCAQLPTPLQAAQLAVYFHGWVADQLWLAGNDRGITSSDILRAIPKMWHRFNNDNHSFS